MSSFWSIWITVLTLGTLIGCVVLLRWCLKNFTDVPEGESMGHEFDGIEELNNPLPKWWSTFFLLTVIWGFAYLLFYPGLGNWKGLFGWTSSNQGIVSIEDSRAKTLENKEAGMLVQYDREVESANAKYGPIFAAFSSRTIEDLATDEEALKIGQRLFLQNCAQCHGSNAKGTTGFPDLTDNDWLYGGSPEDIKASLIYGRQAQGMMAWDVALGGEQGVKDVAAYVLSLSGREAKEGNVDTGKEKFAVCAACHGNEGQGSHAMGLALGAPALNDNIWLYGGSEKAVQESIRNGRAGVMPAWLNILGEEKIHVISAYVYSLSQED
ncbi:cytochrome-c oxidase, cbb3-type subunit III [Thalassotalea agarivorans]|uniref:Cbb3-type cytochrome c oxidase subunit n=1 Tax=Thalassotalea agarivorans TaxID=349064 RepID=A0A1I0HCP0_THASX|nr:cytochrome-c oxidase, cbb3-type subunit III [Thalassotalea agarivorans]SET81648.1 cytochrome c oxidase cbb3-type subunit 3 [Thalassotalea agarivorans]